MILNRHIHRQNFKMVLNLYIITIKIIFTSSQKLKTNRKATLLYLMSLPEGEDCKYTNLWHRRLKFMCFIIYKNIVHALSQSLSCAPPYENNYPYKDWIFLNSSKDILKANELGTLEVWNNAHIFHWDILTNWSYTNTKAW